MKSRAFAVLFEFVSRAAAGLVLAAPVTSVITAANIGAFAEGDRLLFESGGLFLAEIARSSWTLFAPLGSSSLVTAVLLSVALTLPRAVLWSAMADDSASPLATLLARATLRVPPLLALAGLAFLAQVLVCLLGVTVAEFVRRALANPIHGDAAALATIAAAGALALVIGMVRDLASAAAACGVGNARGSLRAGAVALLRAPSSAFALWLGPALLELGLVLAGAVVTGALDVSRPGTARVVGVALVHQSVVLGLSLCRALWFGRAARLVRAQLALDSAARR